MKKPFRQIPISELPRGFDWPVALLAELPPDFSRVFSIKFERARDDLDDLDGSALVTDSGVFFLLKHHLNAPIKGTQIVIIDGAKDSTFKLNEALRALKDLNPTTIWRHPGI